MFQSCLHFVHQRVQKNNGSTDFENHRCVDENISIRIFLSQTGSLLDKENVDYEGKQEEAVREEAVSVEGEAVRLPLEVEDCLNGWLVVKLKSLRSIQSGN